MSVSSAMACRNYDNNFFEISVFAALKSCKFDQFYVWEAVIEDKTFVEFLQNLENTIKEFSEGDQHLQSMESCTFPEKTFVSFRKLF